MTEKEPTRRDFLRIAGGVVGAAALGPFLGETGAVAEPVFVRSFVVGSWWNTPIPATLPVDRGSAAMTRAQAKSCPPPDLGGPDSAWAMPWSEVVMGGDLATIRDAKGRIVQLYIDTSIGQMTGDDKAMVWRDWKTGIEVSTFETNVARKANGSIDTRKPITCTRFGFYKLESNGIDAKAAGGDPENSGHRGIPPSAMALHPDEQTGIRRRLKCSLGQPADHPGPNWPMVGIESPRSGAIPEGAVIRLRHPVAGNVVQEAAHDYGFVVGDTAGAGKSNIKTVLGGSYAAAVLNGLDGTTWDEWDVMTLGWT